MGFTRNEIAAGTPVYSSDNEKLGKVVQSLDSGFEIEKGFFFPKDYMVSYGEILRMENGALYLNLTKAQLKERWESAEAGSGGYRGEGARTRGYGSTLGTTERGLNTKEEVRIPVAEEELEVTKRERELGAVRVTKEVVTETKKIDVPVTREEVRVERVPVSETRSPAAGEATFQEGTVTVPIREEEIEIRKRPVVKEEVRISKEAHREERQVRETLRKEKVDVDDEALRRRSTTSPEIRAGGLDEGFESDSDSDRMRTREPPLNPMDPDYKKF